MWWPNWECRTRGERCCRRQAGKYRERKIARIDNSDIVAMKTKCGGETCFAFARANEKSHGETVAHP